MSINRISALLIYIPVFVLSFCSSLEASEGQDKIHISMLPGDSANISRFMREFYDGSAQMSAIDIAALPEDKWQECSDTIHNNFKPGINYWFRFAINNDTDAPLDRLFYFPRFERVELYTKDNLNEPIEGAGEILPIREWSYAADNHGVKIHLDSDESQTYYVKCSFVKESKGSAVWFVLRSYENARSFQAYEIRAKMADILFFLFFLGSVTFCLVYFIGQYALKYRDKAFFCIHCIPVCHPGI